MQISRSYRKKTLVELAETARFTDALPHDNTQDSFEKADSFYNRKEQDGNFALGDTAYMYGENVPVGTLRKLHCFGRPVEILESVPNFCYKVKGNTSGRILPFNIRVIRLKKIPCA